MHRMAAALTLACVVLVPVACGSSSKTGAPTAPAPTTTTAPAVLHGPFLVGTRTETFVDTSRPTMPNGSAPAATTRTFRTTIAYPAQGTPDADHPVAGAAPISAHFPVIVYAHGFSGSGDSPYLYYLAAAGFVVVGPNFPLTKMDAPGGPNRSDAVNEPRDVAFVISQMSHLPARDADLQRVVDTNKVGVMGASLGSGVAFDVGEAKGTQDPRVQATVAVAGTCSPCTYSARPTPLLLINGSVDPFSSIAVVGRTYAGAPAPKFFVTLIGAKHIRYDQPFETIAAKSMIDFFDRYLENDTQALPRLAVDANVAGKAQLQQATG